MITQSDMEEHMIIFPAVTQDRGRFALRVTHHRVGADVDSELLDSQAPLTDDDRHALSNCELIPEGVTHEVERHVRARIHAVQQQLWGRSLRWRDD